MDAALYTFLLDFFPLTDEVYAENVVLGLALQQTALEAMGDCEKLARLKVLLHLVRDLGYATEEVVGYLEKQLARV